VVALADSDREALDRAGNQFKVQRRVADYRDLLDDQTIEALAICVPASLHVEIALAALAAGKHLFIEKPLALNLEDCDRLIERAAGLKLQVMLGFNTRWHRLAREARTLIRQGVLGPLEAVRGALTSYHEDLPEWRKRRASGGGVLLEMAVHQFDLWRYLLDEEVAEIHAYSRSGVWEDEAATITARLRCGALASATLAECTTADNRIEIYGRLGSLGVSFYQFDGLEISARSEIPGSIGARIRGLKKFAAELPKAIATQRRGGEWFQSYVEEWRHFAASIQTGLPVECGLEDGRRALACALAAMASAASGKSVSILTE
jgi:myo-inositol 2-dehydrogenase/D-chiro-inositol 1-dehydrogenase